MHKDELIARIKQTSYIEGDFVLRSGLKSNYYLDKYLFETCTDILAALGEEFGKYIDDRTTIIAGAELGGVALAVSAALTWKRNWIIVRNSKKDYGTAKMIEGTLRKDDVVLLVEDIATTGGQVIEAARIIRDAGGQVDHIVAVIDRKQGARENIETAGFKFSSILTVEDLGLK
jgi:orotate phosphoribosyltransferase